jgi:flagellar basal-body rod protein FlgB
VEENMSFFDAGLTNTSDSNAINTSKAILDYLATRQKVVASNVANINTPGYKARDISFENVLKSKSSAGELQMRVTDPRHFTMGAEGPQSYDVFYANAPANSADATNDVDLDKEMLKMGELQTNFNVFTELLRSKYDGIRKVIQGNA